MNDLMKSFMMVIVTAVFISIYFEHRISELEYKIEVLEMVEVSKDPTLNFADLELNKDNFNYVCTVLEIAHPEIVYAQAQLESGRFTSNLFKTRNNFLGLYDSKKHEYFKFNHWSDCLNGYKQYVQRKWDGNSDYYTFLVNLPYAEDPNYISKVKKLACQY